MLQENTILLEKDEKAFQKSLVLFVFLESLQPLVCLIPVMKFNPESQISSKVSSKKSISIKK